MAQNQDNNDQDLENKLDNTQNKEQEAKDNSQENAESTEVLPHVGGVSLDELKAMSIFDNISNAEDHLKTRQDSKNRLNNLGLILPTIEKYDLKIKVREEGEMRYKYIKKYSNGKISLVSLSIDNKILYTIIPSIRE